ncbi:hypothetical protein GCM10027443_22770 [Pontibacter brevis]
MEPSFDDMTEEELIRMHIFSFVDTGKYKVAEQELDILFEEAKSAEGLNIQVLAEIAGCYVTVGTEGYDSECVNKGLNFFIKNKELLSEYFSAASLDYNIGNGKHALFKIAMMDSDALPTPQLVKDYLHSSKSSFLRAFNTIDLRNLDDLSIQILNNLANDLDCAGRVVEALQLYDMVLEASPDFPFALFSKANCMEYMIHTTDGPLTAAFYAELYSLYQKVVSAEGKEDIKARALLGLEKSKMMLNHFEVELSKLPEELTLSKEEYLAHSHYRRFTLDNFLSLSEHGLYCRCAKAKQDNLSIGFPGMHTAEVRLMKLEVLLNRLKSEFSLARKLYYQYVHDIDIEDDVFYEDLFIGENNGLKIEKLRTSFRLCFGILDKIAKGICFAFELEVGKNESIYFERFWNGNNETSKKRWEKLNSLSNIHLTALYSIASDLNSQSGELSLYKSWRNLLEHNALVVRNESFDSYDLFSNTTFLESVGVDLFSEKTKHLLQLTRAAIFSYTFCVRHEIVGREIYH